MSYQIENTGKPHAKSSRKKIFLIGLGTLAATMLTFFGIQYWRKNRSQTSTSDSTAPAFKATKPKKPATKPKAEPKAAPKAKAAPPPKAAPKSAPTSKPIDATATAKGIHASLLKKDFAKTLEQVKKIKTTKDYSAVSKVFSTLFVGGVRQTLVNGLLNSFKDEKQKQAFRKEFAAMGLKYDGKKWALSGIENLPQIITTTETKVWKNPKTAVSVPVNMVLGREVCKRGSFTLFENDKQYFLVDSNAVKLFQS